MATHKNIRLLKWFNFFTDFKLYHAVAILYFSHVAGSFALGMSIFSIAMISSAVFELPTGIFSDRIGRRKTVIWGAGAAVVYTVFYAIGHSYWILVIGALFEGLSRAFYSGNNDALLHDTLAESKEEHLFGEHLGPISAMFQAALAISSLIGGFLANWSFGILMWLSVVPQVICLYLSFLLKEPQIHTKQSSNIFSHLKEAYLNFIKSRKLRLLSISSIIGESFGEATYQFQAVFYSLLLPVWAVGVVKAYSNVLSTIGFQFSGPILKRFDGLKILLPTNIFNRAIVILAVVFPTAFSPIMIATPSFFYGLITVARNSLMQKEFTNEQRATMGSLNSFAGSIVFGIVAFLVGYAADRLSPGQAILYLQIVQSVNLIVYWKLFHHKSDSAK